MRQLLMLSVLIIAGCTAEAKQPQHALEIGDPVYARTKFPSLEACETFRDRLIVVLPQAHKAIPEPMRCN